MEPVSFSSFSQGLKLFLIMGALGTLFSAMAYLICRYPNMRRAQFREWGPHPRMGMALGGAILLSFFLGAWNMTFARFYAMGKDGNNIILIYHFPARQELRPCESVKKAVKQVVNPKNQTWELGIFLADGKTRKSAPTGKDAFEKAIAPLEGRLCGGLEISTLTP